MEGERHGNSARCVPTSWVKLGGKSTCRLNGFGWHRLPSPPTSDQLASATRDYYLHTIDKFGTRRCMFESNFPVDRVSCSYAVVVERIQEDRGPEFTKDERSAAIPSHRD